MTKSEEEEVAIFGVLEDDFEIEEVILNRKIDIEGEEFLYGYAAIRMVDEIKSYFAIKIKKDRKIDPQLDLKLLGEIPYMIELDDDNLLYLRAKLDKMFITNVGLVKMRGELLTTLLESK